MMEHQIKGIHYICDENHNHVRKCKEKKLFMVNLEDISNEEFETSTHEVLHLFMEYFPQLNLPKVELEIFLHTLTSISTWQTLKWVGYIKQYKSIVLIDNGSMNKFIWCNIAQETDWYMHVINNLQTMILNGTTVKCGGHCENVWSWMDDYSLKYPCLIFKWVVLILSWVLNGYK